MRLVEVLADPLLVGVHLELDFLALGFLLLQGLLREFAEEDLLVDVVHELVALVAHDDHLGRADSPVDQVRDQVQLGDLAFVGQFDLQGAELGRERARVGHGVDQLGDAGLVQLLLDVHQFFGLYFDLP